MFFKYVRAIRRRFSFYNNYFENINDAIRFRPLLSPINKRATKIKFEMLTCYTDMPDQKLGVVHTTVLV